MVHPLCFDPHPVLRMKAQPIAAFTNELRRVVADLIETMYANDGVGLAAPQIGRDIQAFVANPSQERGRELVMVNPRLERADSRVSVLEGCLSLPHRWARVRRANHVRLCGQDVAGQLVVIEAEGLLAVVLQHELDHLQGRLFTDRLSWIRRMLLEARVHRRPGRACASSS